VAVEPIKKCIKILDKNIRGNKLSRKTLVLEGIVSNGEAFSFEEHENLNHSRVIVGKKGNGGDIRSFKLKDLLREYGCNVLRMDLEGYEYDLLYRNNLKNIDKISLEFHTGIIGIEKTKKLFEKLDKEGFIIKNLIDELPLRLYPFYVLLKAFGLLRVFSRVVNNISLRDAIPYMLSGRSVKHINLEMVRKG
jgi:FkbM family methyltransferase